MKKKLLLVGGTVLNQHFKEGCFDKYNIVESYFGMSPFSLGESPRIGNVSKLSLNLKLRYDVNNDFPGFLNKNKADVIIVDIQKIVDDLLQINGHYCTWQDKSKDEFYTSRSDNRICVTDMKFADFYNLFDSYTDMILKCYNSKNIVLITSCVPMYFAVDYRVRKHKNRFIYNGWYKHFEERFVSRTGCTFYDKSKYYINEKRPGEKTRFAVFEQDYYTEAKRDLELILNGKKYDREPDYAISIKRYIRYLPTLDTKYRDLFLSKDDSVDRFLMACPADFVQDNIQNFIKLKKNGLKHHLFLSKDIYKYIYIYHAFLHAENDPAHAEDIDLIFKNNLQVPSVLNYVREHCDLRFKKQATYNNYADLYYGKPVELPLAIDNIGCCISRFIFNHAEKDFCVNNYAFHYMPLMMDLKVDYSPEIFDESNWEHRMIKLQLDCGINDYLKKNPADWVVIDLYPLVELTAYMCNGKPIGMAGHFGRSVGFQNTHMNEYYDDETIASELKKYADFLKSIYGNNIILIASRRQTMMISDTDKLVPYSNPEVNDKTNSDVRKYEKIFTDYTDCYYVDIVQDFFSDERSQTNLSPVHFEPICYTEEAKIIKRIITTLPEQKHFTEYEPAAHAERILRLKKANNTNNVLMSAFHSEFDRELINMSKSQLEKRIAELSNK